jgi:hypothetical protein
MLEKCSKKCSKRLKELEARYLDKVAHLETLGLLPAVRLGAVPLEPVFLSIKMLILFKNVFFNYINYKRSVFDALGFGKS